MNKKILVTEPYLPNKQTFNQCLESIYQNKWLTNNGPLYQEFTTELKKLFKSEHLLLVSNGTLALQVAYKLKNLTNKKVITTPFTFAATTTALAWENIEFEFCDIDKHTWNLCPNKTEDRLKQGAIDAIVPVNIFGMPCDMEAFDFLSRKYGVPVIYDSAHAPFSTYKERSIFEFGDIHCVSLHATKLLHSVEGGVITFKYKEDFERAKKLINFGQDDNGIVNEPGINAKLSEFHAAMGLCVSKEIEELINIRKKLIALYKQNLEDFFLFQHASYDNTVTPMYFPIKCESKKQLLNIKSKLAANNIYARHYFDPSNLKFLSSLSIPSTCNKIASSVLCLPLSSQLSNVQVNTICKIIKES
ncbi:DegT/DnrJ/EryC1/StrS family aminotransferase [Pseudoalteromonas sp. G4]|uniref:DegT/DnrJ/EryC1/StrS family aminotransferase n=1 Tax=Pseudoalteromonas sp. G4 TaxID=2992761 RepID=UPI00237ED40B|nr:DegT/DnrJ/EryC1/StrS family aminotransferase [Pseudoalteromonas sp. G4]MDE3271248.1 DegT/DnrJ/EryC1/StrS family aminotransferase [Pseudoalteromonas sp. G4]